MSFSNKPLPNEFKRALRPPSEERPDNGVRTTSELEVSTGNQNFDPRKLKRINMYPSSNR